MTDATIETIKTEKGPGVAMFCQQSSGAENIVLPLRRNPGMTEVWFMQQIAREHVKGHPGHRPRIFVYKNPSLK